MIFFVTMCALLFTAHRIPHPKYSLPNFRGVFPDRCVRQPWTIDRGWPMYSRTDDLAIHPRHKTGPCKYESTYHPMGLAVNSILAVTVAAIVTFLVVSGPDYFARRAAWRRERAMIDAQIAKR